MEAKDRVDFINSISSSTDIKCHICGTTNESGSVFCSNCGNKLIETDIKSAISDINAFSSIDASSTSINASTSVSDIGTQNTASVMNNEKPGGNSVFASIIDSDSSADGSIINNIDSIEEIDVFAEGLPVWDIVPPEIRVRRKK